MENTTLTYKKTKLGDAFRSLTADGSVVDCKKQEIMQELIVFPVWSHSKRADLVECCKANFKLPVDGRCFACHAVNTTTEDAQLCNSVVRERLLHMEKRISYEWPNETSLVSVDNFLKQSAEDLHARIENCPQYQSFAAQNVEVQHIEVKVDPTSPNMNEKCKGGEYPAGHVFEEGQLFGAPDDGTFGLLS